MLGSWLQGSWLDFDVEFFFAVLALVFQIADQRLIADREQLAPALGTAIPTVFNHVALLLFIVVGFFGFRKAARVLSTPLDHKIYMVPSQKKKGPCLIFAGPAGRAAAWARAAGI